MDLSPSYSRADTVSDAAISKQFEHLITDTGLVRVLTQISARDSGRDATQLHIG